MIDVTDILALQQLPEIEPLDLAEPGLLALCDVTCLALATCQSTCGSATCSYTCGRVSCRTTAP